MVRSILVIGLVSSAALIGGCASGDKTEEPPTTASASMGILNDKCPVMGGDVDPGAETAAYHGYEIGFCCNGCKGKWDDMNDAAKQAFVAKYTE
ncbi:MAG: hypothetical protein ACYTJ0_01655 [Planctomycetota bacterium]|jgi:hypothetical protein